MSPRHFTPRLHRGGRRVPRPLRGTGAGRGRPPPARGQRRHRSTVVAARRCGFGTAETLRRPFLRRLGVPPTSTAAASARRLTQLPTDRCRPPTTDRPRPPRGSRPCSIAIPLFPQFTALDAHRPVRGAPAPPGHRRDLRRPRSAARSAPTTASSASTVDATFEELPHPDVVVFPGGVGTRPLMDDERVLDWVRTRPRDHRRSRPRCARDRSCSARPACSTGSPPRPTGAC